MKLLFNWAGDNFDMLAPNYLRTAASIGLWFARAGLLKIEVGYRSNLVWLGNKPV